MINIKNKSVCCGCGACVQICTRKCIDFKSDEEGFFYPSIDIEKCIGCGRCESACPMLHDKQCQESYTEAYVGFALDDKIRKNSSSGGLFSIIAEYVLNNGGVVYGAVFAEDWSVVHCRECDKDGLKMLRGSKYSQSNINNTFLEAKRDLDNGMEVLFTGTACQIAGLKHFVQKEYDNLYTIDVLCHGVPSPLLWRNYLMWRSKKREGRLLGVNFRSKSTGWKEYSVELKFEDEKKETNLYYKNVFMQMFLADICLRPSCHSCEFKGLNRFSDISLGDAWGVNQFRPDMDDNQGTSLIVIHTYKGKRLLRFIEDKIVKDKININEILPPDAASRKAVLPHRMRKYFFSALKIHGIRIFSIWKMAMFIKKVKNKILK